MRKFLIGCSAAALLLLWGCGGSKETSEAPKKEEAPAAAPAAAVSDADAATVTGKVAFTGDKPAMKNISMDATPACARAHTTPQKSQEVVVNDNGTLRNVFVWVKSGLPDKQWPKPDKVRLDQKGCMYIPHVTAMMVGQQLLIKNSDPFLHNIHALSQINPAFNKAQNGKNDGEKFDSPKAPENFHVKCDVHPWMSCFVAIFDHPYFSVSGDDGRFNIKVKGNNALSKDLNMDR